jgi:hypothetical protein
MRKIAALGVLVALTLGGGSAGGGTATTGLRGLVKRGPIMPVCRIGVPCDEPARGVKLKFSRSGKVVATATTNQRGWYRVTLRAGRYSVSTTRRAAPETSIQPRLATVAAGRMKRRDFFIDTGIR